MVGNDDRAERRGGAGQHIISSHDGVEVLTDLDAEEVLVESAECR